MPPTSEQLQTFLQALAVDRGHLGLVVTKADPRPLDLRMPDVGMSSLDLDAATDPEAAVSLLFNAAHEGGWVRLNLVDGSLPGRLYNQLRLISTSGHLDAAMRGQAGNVQELRWPGTSKVIVVASQKALDKISVPTFLNLFGPILRES